ncbi:MAG TPA: alpha/beta hydrolase [Pseudolabrys sp.]|nr:alpha/beta hydrolase [Pseudolabrys sp.]
MTSSAEDRVAFTKRNWMGRFLRAEVSYGDVQRIMDRIKTWGDWLPAWAETAQQYEQRAEAAEQRGARRTAAEAWRRAALCWHFGKFNWHDDIDKAEHAQHRLTACFDRALWSLKPPGEKVRIPYGNAMMAGILRKPAGIDKPPVVIVMGGLDSVKEELQQVADYFLDRGMATLGMDGPGQGETGLTLKIEAASEKPVGAAIDFIERIDGVDASRVGLYGQSLGGYYVTRACAFEPRIKAAVASAGPYTIADHWDHLPPMTRMGYEYRTGAGSPEEARARVAALDLTGVAERVTCPLLVLHGTADEIVPFAHGERIAREAKNATFMKYEGGNHSLSNRHFEVRTGLSDWMARMLGGTL